MEKLNGQSLDLLAQHVEALRKIFPEAFEEGKIDFDKLKALLGNYVDTDDERYDFTWHGKEEALRLSQTPSMGTLRPCREKSKHWDSTDNLYIEGDNLEVLKLLAKSYQGKVKMIYIDPPYNTGNDFVYKDDYQDNIRNYKDITGQSDEAGKDFNTNSESNGRFHTDWLNMMYPRLRIARELLTRDGVIFISIDDHEVENLRKICDAIFGEINLVAQIPWQSRASIQNDTDFSVNHEYILCYAKNRRISNRRLKISNEDEWNKRDSFVCRPLPVDKTKFDNPDNDPRGPWKADPFDAPHIRPNLTYPITNPLTGEQHLPPSGRCWRIDKNRFSSAFRDNRIVFGKDGKGRPQLKVFYEEKKNYGSIDNSWFSADRIGTATLGTKELIAIFQGNVYFETPKPNSLLKKLLYMANLEENSIILDFFSGSATTAHAVMQLNAEDGGHRKFIMVQLPEPCQSDSEAYKAGYKTICDIGEERIRRAGEKILQDSVTGGKKNTEDLDVGFKVFTLDTSNLKRWQPEEEHLEESLLDYRDNFLPGRSREDELYEVLLKMGLPLTASIEERTGAGLTVYVVSKGALLICLDREISLGLGDFLVDLKKEYDPETCEVVLMDKGFASSVEKTNIMEALKCGGLEEDQVFTI